MAKKIGILPASGTATRMRGLPKFLLPYENGVETLLERHISQMLEVVEEIIIPTREQNIELITRLELTENVKVIALNTQTMSETVSLVLGNLDFELCILGMPDTYFLGDFPYQKINTSEGSIRLACWKTASSQIGHVGSVEMGGQNVLQVVDKDPAFDFGWHWGAMGFKKEALAFLDASSPHVGYMINPAIKSGLDVSATSIDGEYIDCGTFSEYARLISLLH